MANSYPPWIFPTSPGAGSVGVITGAYTGDEEGGAVTRFKDFEGWMFRKKYGPASGRLEYGPGIISEQHSDVWTQDLVAEAEFVNPPNSDWSYGFVIRHPENTRLDVVGVTGNRMWYHQTRNAGAGNGDYPQLAEGCVPAANFRDRNHLFPVAIQEIGLLFINGQLIDWLDLSHNLDYGNVSVMAGFYNGHTSEPEFENFIVWTP